ncbi:MAG: hypothetical protein J6D47_16480 [Peptostreptococcaceae bacterium]|nr:hypothetical protein [Peptostreptococcaceae bacterium]
MISKKSFINKLKNAHIRLDHMSDRQLDYKYLEYNLFLILDKYRNNDFSLLGIKDNLEIVTYPFDNDYNIYTRTPVTLNAELYRLYESGYFNSNEDFIRYVTFVIDKYKYESITIKTLVKVIRKQRLKGLE